MGKAVTYVTGEKEKLRGAKVSAYILKFKYVRLLQEFEVKPI